VKTKNRYRKFAKVWSPKEQARFAALDTPEVRRFKNRARQALRDAIRRGKIIPQPCEKCGYPLTDGHHTDYAKPLDVQWLCRTCHIIAHGKKPRKTPLIPILDGIPEELRRSIEDINKHINTFKNVRKKKP
jgi:hypothetical protein